MSWRYTSLVRSGHWSEPNSCLKQHRQRHNNPESMCSVSATTWLLRGKKTLNCWSDSIFDLDQNDLLFQAQGSSGKTSTSGLDLLCEGCCHSKNVMPIYKWISWGIMSQFQLCTVGKYESNLPKKPVEIPVLPKHSSKWTSLPWRRDQNQGESDCYHSSPYTHVNKLVLSGDSNPPRLPDSDSHGIDESRNIFL